MYKVRCIYDADYVDTYAYSIYDFPFEELTAEKHRYKRVKYIDTPATFDIEASTIYKEQLDEYESFMYIWQMCVEGHVCFGRTWDEFLSFLNTISIIYDLNEGRKLVIYVHNLSYEFMFIKDFIKFTNIFATEEHKVLKCANDKFEFRCSYRLSNMTLEKFILNTPGAHYYKGVNDLDYHTMYLPSDDLTPIEYGYCYNDVMGLYEAVLYLLKEDNIKSIPMTQTGYVRRDCKKAVFKNKRNRYKLKKNRLTLDLLELCQECYRGGNTASSRFLTDMILKDVSTWDISSSFPYVMLLPEYPISKFMYTSVDDIDYLTDLNNKYCTIGRYTFINLRLKPGIPVPYLPSSKCREMYDVKQYNGRILSAEYLETSLTSIDFKIIMQQYDFDELYSKDVWYARKGFLPKEIRNVVLEYFELKSRLKYSDDENDKYLYAKAKARLNSIYGMMVSHIIHDDISINDNGEWIRSIGDRVKKLDDYYESWSAFTEYQCGIFITALARQRLQEAIDLIGLDTAYCDTDSVKYVGEHDDVFEKINNDMIELNKKLGITHSCTINDKTFYLGTWDKEKTYNQFITLGAKKYAYTIGDKIGVTVAGLSKKLGAEELERGNGLHDFYNGKVFVNSGRTVAYFNNHPVHTLSINGCDIKTASSISIVDTTYTLGITETMLSIIDEERGIK